MSHEESPPLSPESAALFAEPFVLHRHQRLMDAEKARNDEVMTRNRAVVARTVEAPLAIKEPSFPPPLAKPPQMSKKDSKRPLDESSKKDRRSKKSKTSGASSETTPVTTVQPFNEVPVAGALPSSAVSSTEVLADILRAAQGDLPEMTSSSTEENISVGWAYGIKFLSQVQRIYEFFGKDSKSARDAADEASGKLVKAEARIAYLEKVREGQKKEVASMAERLEEGISSRDAEIATLRRQLESLSHSKDAEIRRAVKEALRAYHSSAEGQMNAVKARLKSLRKDYIVALLTAKENAANLSLLEDLQKRKEVDLDEEIRRLKEDHASDPHAERAFNSELMGIVKLLRLSPPSPISVEDGMKGSSLELMSAEVGVSTQFGSNNNLLVVDGLLAEEEKEKGEKGAPDEAQRVAKSPEQTISRAAEVSTSPEKVGEGDSEKPSADDPPVSKETEAVIETPKDANIQAPDETPTPSISRGGDQAAAMSEVRTPSENKAPDDKEGKTSSGSSDIWDKIDLEC